MPSKITHIRLSEIYPTTSERITHIKIDSGTIQTIEQVVRYIDTIPMDYYYIGSIGSTSIIEAVHPTTGKSYIRTKSNNTISDSILTLPIF